MELIKSPTINKMENKRMEVILSTKPNMSSLPGGWDVKTDMILDDPFDVKVNKLIPHAFVLEDLFSERECDMLIDLFLGSGISAPVSIQGRQDIVDDRMGSVRATGWSVHLAEQFRNKLNNILLSRYMIDTVATDWWQGFDGNPPRWWHPFGVTPMMRFMKYQTNGQHYSHYDAGYIYPDKNYRSLMSFVLYLTTNPDSGATRFIRDGQEHKPVWERNHDDWTRETKPEEVIASVRPKKGSMLIFDHRLCHDVEKYDGPGDRIIIRGDILYTSYPAYHGVEN